MKVLSALLLLIGFTHLQAQEKQFINIINSDITERFEEKNSEYYKLKGNIQLEHDGMILFCDSAYLFETENKFEAFGTVKLNKDDSVSLESDSLFYNGNSKLSHAQGNVLLKHDSILLISNSLYYDMQNALAYYNNQGIIYNRADTLSSLSASYYMDEKRVNFQDQVSVRNTDYQVDSENMTYMTTALELHFSEYTHLQNDSLDLFFNKGYYNRRTEIAHCRGNVKAIKTPHRLVADSLYLDKPNNRIEAFDNVIIVDSVQKLEISGHKAIINKTDFTGEITESPIAKQYQDLDTFYLKAKRLYTFKEANYWNLHAYNDVKFYKKDIQGVAKILKYNQQIGYIELFHEPVLWSDESQISADSIRISMTNNEIDSLFLDHNVFIIQEVDSSANYYSQIKGRHLRGKFNASVLEKINIRGNAESKYYVINKKEEAEGLNFIQCSGINMTMGKGKIDKVDFLQQPNGEYIPIQDLTNNEKFLKNFKWIPKLRPIKNEFIQ